MSKLNLPKELILGKKELAEICGGNYVCTCWNEDGTKTVMPKEATSPEHCAAMCAAYWNSAASTTTTTYSVGAF